jgi:hypothetical protein
MFVSLDKKFIILFPPKTASTSIQSAMNKTGIKFDFGKKELEYPIFHLKLSELCELHNLTNIENYKILQFTRNPYYRFVSSYYQLMRHEIGNNTSLSFYGMGFKEFVHHFNKSKVSNDFIKMFFGNESYYYNNIKLKKHWSGVRLFEEQVSWNDLNKKIHYFKIENIFNDMSSVSKLLECGVIPIENTNKNPLVIDYNDLLDEECMNIISQHFNNDFKILNY